MTHVSVVFTLLLVGSWSMPAHTQEMNRRRGGPRDWSHSRVIASEFRADADQNQNLRKHWRT
jgi:hypothetical protein